MYDYRLNHVDWYDPIEDKIRCLKCGRMFDRLNKRHLKHHNFKSIEDYRKEYKILPRTPLTNKRLLYISHDSGMKSKNLVPNKGEFLIRQSKSFSEFSEFKSIYKDVAMNRRGTSAPRKVAQYFDSKLFNLFDSMSEASKKLNIRESNISRSIKSKYKAGGYEWAFVGS